jgi:predicted PurR-regulated permease PerM
MTERTVRFRRSFLLLLALGVSAVFLYMIRDYLMPLLLAAVFSGLVMPVCRRIQGRVGGRKAVAAALTLLLLLVAVGLPLVGFVAVVVAAAIEVTTDSVPWIQEAIRQPSGVLERAYVAVPRLRGLDPYRGQILTRVAAVAENAGNFLLRSMSALTGGTFGFLLGLFVMLYAMFFFLIGGGRTLDKVLAYVPLPPEDKERLVGRFLSVARATIKGSLVVGLVQALLAGLAFWAAGIGAAAFWATIVFVLSMLPGIGAPLVWVPAAIYLAATGRVGAAIALAAWCTLVVGTIDNVLRPRLVGGDTRMPDLLILVSTLGGLTLFGAAGIIVGPIIAALFITVWEIYGAAFQDLLAGGTAPAGPAAAPEGERIPSRLPPPGA